MLNWCRVILPPPNSTQNAHTDPTTWLVYFP